MIRSFQSTCLHKNRIAPGVYELHFSKPESFTFLPGQFVLFDVPLVGNPQDIQARAYSIASAPTEEILLFVIKLVPNGRASRWIDESVDAGTVISFKGPFGAFTLDKDTTKPYLFAATGTGIAPLRSQLLWTLEKQKDTRPIHLIFGVLRKEDLFWEETWKQLEHDHPNLHVHGSFLNGDADWHDERGSVQERVQNAVTDPSNVSVYLCGDPMTVTELKRLCLHQGVPKEDIHAEAYV